jgi:hypothetical protein
MKRRARQSRSIDPLGPTFLSYRRSDGADLALSLAWTLRAMGVPVWRDTDDLPPGDTPSRLREALEQGLSGGVLLVTPQVAASKVIRELEVRRLLQLHRDPAFSLCIANAITNETQEMDLAAPDRLLGTVPRKTLRPSRRGSGPLRDVKQYSMPTELVELARDVARRRVRAVRARGREVLTIHVQTRATPVASGTTAGLVVRTRPPGAGQRIPHMNAWEPLEGLLASLPLLVEESGAKVVRFLGGAHLSIGLALGSALPTTSGVHVEVEDVTGDRWRLATSSQAELGRELVQVGPDGPVMVAVDVNATEAPIDTFATHVQSDTRGAAAMRLKRIGHLAPDSAGELVRRIGDEIASWATQHSTTEVDVFLRAPFQVALLLGRILNTLRVTTYEWDDAADPPRYVPVLTLSPGHGGGPVMGIHGHHGPS